VLPAVIYRAALVRGFIGCDGTTRQEQAMTESTETHESSLDAVAAQQRELLESA
jgi:hypothetical protein